MKLKIGKILGLVSLSLFLYTETGFALNPKYQVTELRAEQININEMNHEMDLYKYQWYLNNYGKVPAIVHINKGLETPAGIVQSEKSYIGSALIGSNPGIDINYKKAKEEYQKTQEKRRVLVALIDTGVDIYHPDLYEAIYVNEKEIPKDGIDNDNNGYVDDIKGWNFIENSPYVYSGTQDAHGTHNAGIISAANDKKGIAGIADSNYVKILPIKALDSTTGLGNETKIKDAIRYAESMGADICNLSLVGTEFDEELYNLMKNSKMLFVVAAGNGDNTNKGFDIDKTKVYPAAFELDNIISVGNMNFDGKLEGSSNFGKESVDILAPGSFIFSTMPEGKYGLKSGTSMAAPVVSGVAASVYSFRTDLSLPEVKEAILQTARKSDDLKDKVRSSGFVDMYKAYLYSKN